MANSTSAAVPLIAYCHKLKNPVPYGDGMPEDSISRTAVLAVVASLRSDVQKLRTHLGLHRCEEDKNRFEHWLCTSGKLWSLRNVQEAVESLPPSAVESDELLFHKLNFSLAKDFLSERIAAFSDELARSDFGLGAEDLGHVSHRRDEAVMLFHFLNDLGNAGVQPKDKETEPEPMGTAPVTVPVPRVSDLHALIPGSGQRLTVADLQRISEWCLDRLDESGLPSRWEPSRSCSVGEASMED